MKKKLVSIVMVLVFILSSFVVSGFSTEAKSTTKKITFKINGKTATGCKVKVSSKSVSLKGNVMSWNTYKKMFKKAPQRWGGGDYVYDPPIMKNGEQIGLTLLSYYPNERTSSKGYIDLHYEGFEICGIKRGMTEKKAYKKLKKIFGKNNIKKEKVKKDESYIKNMKNYKSVKYKYVIDGTKGYKKRFIFSVYVGKGKVQAIIFKAGDYSELAER